MDTKSKAGRPVHYDWAQIRDYYNAGHTLTQCMDRFGFSRGAWQTAVNAGKLVTRNPVVPIEELLVNGIDVYRHRVKKRMLRAHMFEMECALCKVRDWQGSDLGFHLDHIDGNERNFERSNLRLLCPNCHSQTPNYCGRNRRNVRNPRNVRMDGPQAILDLR